MFRCAVCQFAVELDDATLSNQKGQCICLSCYLRETGTDQPMPKTLLRQLSAVLMTTAGPA